MGNTQESRPDLKKRDAATTVVSDVLNKDINLKIILPGQLGSPVSSKLNDYSLIQILKSKKEFENFPHWKIEKSFKKLSEREKRNIAKRNPELAPNYHNDRKVTEACRVLHLTNEQILGFVHSGEIPAKFSRKKGEWLKLSERERLEFHFSQISEGLPFTWEYVG